MTNKLSYIHSIYAFDKSNEPTIQVNSEDTITIETYDCFTNQIQADTTIDWDQINPATDPIYVENYLERSY